MSISIKIEVLKLHPEFYCRRTGVCTRMYTCVNPEEFPSHVCPDLIIKSPGRSLHEEIRGYKKDE